MRQILLIIILSISFGSISNTTSSNVYLKLQKLHSLKRVLYIAAHPDDENTRALAYFSLGEKAETAYLSLTRGDGGQNLIGNELSEDLGVLRTQELLSARSFDGAKQYFTRAVDFGYSKSALESFNKWGKSEILADVVRVIRQFKPDVIITRFPPDKRAGHGHHTASAIIAIEALEKAADPNFLPEMVSEFGVWQTTSIYWNTSIWWDKKLDIEAKNNPDYLVTDIGGYNALLGQSYNEIGTLARSEHKCQGFGAVIERGSRIEYFKHLGGKKLKDSFFENELRTWTDLLNEKFDDTFSNLLSEFNLKNLAANIPALIELKKGIDLLPNSILKKEKLALCQQIIIDCLGLYIEIVGKDYALVQNNKMVVQLNIINRSSLDVKLVSINNSKDSIINVNENLPTNKLYTKSVEIHNNSRLSNPYWLELPFINLFKILNKENFGKAEEEPTFSKNVVLKINNENIEINVPATYKWREPSYGERRREIISTPKFAVNFEQSLAILKENESKIIKLNIHSFQDELVDHIRILAPEGWEVTPSKIEFSLKNKHENKWVEFTIKAGPESKRGILKIIDATGKEQYSITEIIYNHIPTQVIFKPIELECIKLDAIIKKGKIAYIKGVEDALPEAITQLGFEVDVFEVTDLSTVDLSIYQSVVLGIRIYNVHPELKNFDSKLNTYVFDGGNVIMQYNTASRSISDQKFGPKPFELSRNRVTEENAEVTFLNPEHPILNVPNKLTKKDFDSWVQERGLYFAKNWDENYVPIFGWHDEGEELQKGALIVAKYGKGQFVYTGISFFRELPNGVEGAYRLFANLLSY